MNTDSASVFLHDRVVIKRLDATETKHGSIIIPDSAKEKPQPGEVVAVGSGKLDEKGDARGGRAGRVPAEANEHKLSLKDGPKHLNISKKIYSHG